MNIKLLKRWSELLKRSGSNTKKQVREEIDAEIKSMEVKSELYTKTKEILERGVKR